MNKNDLSAYLHKKFAEAMIIHFHPSEILFLGSAHYSGKAKNDLPPENVLADLVRVTILADQLRSAFGSPLRVLSAYRSPAYNKAIGGAKHSCHLEGKALDLAPVAPGKADELKTVARRMHDAQLLPGGLGIYPAFVHIDVGRFRSW